MTRDEAKDIFRMDVDSYGKPKAIMTKINMIYDDFESRNCGSCEFNKDCVCANDESPMLGEFVSERLWCEEFERKEK